MGQKEAQPRFKTTKPKSKESWNMAGIHSHSTASIGRTRPQGFVCACICVCVCVFVCKRGIFCGAVVVPWWHVVSAPVLPNPSMAAARGCGIIGPPFRGWREGLTKTCRIQNRPHVRSSRRCGLKKVCRSLSGCQGM